MVLPISLSGCFNHQFLSQGPSLALGRSLLYACRMRLLRRRLTLAAVPGLLAASGLPSFPAVAQSLNERRQSLIGIYDGNQSEIAAGIELRADGRFLYGLSYGALDEEAEGRWSVKDDAVLLTSDPVTPPRFVLVEEHDGPFGSLSMKLDLPKGMSGQYFRATLRFEDGTIAEQQLTEKGELAVTGVARRPVSITLHLPIAGVSSDPSLLSGAGGHQLGFRFEPHDLGKVAFEQTALRIEGNDLVLGRHDRTLHFHRQRAPEVPGPGL
jgi:hypothetical protein